MVMIANYFTKRNTVMILYLRFRLYFDIKDEQWPIIYDVNYNVSFLGLEKFHIFDAKKWGNIILVCCIQILYLVCNIQ